MDWHEVALGSIGLLVCIGGWVWMRTVQQLDRIDLRLDDHVEADRIEFGKVYERIYTEVRALDNRVDDRFRARDR